MPYLHNEMGEVKKFYMEAAKYGDTIYLEKIKHL